MKSHQKKFRYSKSVIFLPCLLLYLFITANTDFSNQVQATRKALGFAIFACGLMGCLFIPSGFINKPNPYLWKAVGGISFFYHAILVYFLYLDRGSALHIIKTYLDPSLSQINYEQVSYGEDCRLYIPESENPWSNFSHAFFDLFAIAHTLGWFGKMIICRDLKLALFSSVVFELIEYSLRDVLNNFKECWWDHVFVDMLGCNLLGIFLGYCYLNYFDLERYKWSLRDAPMKNSAWSNFKDFWTRWDLQGFQAKAFSSTKKFLQMLWFAMFVHFAVTTQFHLSDLALFFVKYIYHIPTDNYMIMFRTFLVALLSANASKEYYRFTAEKEPEIRVNCFMVNMIVLTEWFIVYKHGAGLFEHAQISPLGIFYLTLMISVLLIVLLKIAISDIIRFKNALFPNTISSVPQNSPQERKLSVAKKMIDQTSLVVEKQFKTQ